jgi:hypothetical protein
MTRKYKNISFIYWPDQLICDNGVTIKVCRAALTVLSLLGFKETLVTVPSFGHLLKTLFFSYEYTEWKRDI